jgi:hypothetical protein
MELSTSEILEETLLQAALHQTLGEGFTFQQVNNLQHKAKSTLELNTCGCLLVNSLHVIMAVFCYGS